MALINNPVIVALTQKGVTLALTLAPALKAKIAGYQKRCLGADYEFDEVIEHLQSLFLAKSPIIFIGATGIIIRALAPFLLGKQDDPAVIVIGEDGSQIIPLLGGHHRANRLAHEIVKLTKGNLAITSAGDINWEISLDEPPAGWKIANPLNAKAIMASLLAGESAQIIGDYAPALMDFLAKIPQSPQAKIRIIVSPSHYDLGEWDLQFCPEILTLGIGCARNCPDEMVDAFVTETLKAAQLSPFAIAAIGTIDLKADEQAILKLAKIMNVPLRLFTNQELVLETPRLINPSDIVFKEVGCYGVAEGSALALIGKQGHLILPKAKCEQATMAIAMLDDTSLSPSYFPIPLRGRALGKLSLIGIGPGREDWRTPEASKLLNEADILMGYHLYLDMLKSFTIGKQRVDFELGEEEARCRHALEIAATGRNVALVSSGDIGIYAMAALVFELIDRSSDQAGVSDAAKRVEITTAPGISAFQAAASLAGAPMGHDFCLISLSDLLTPIKAIEQRLTAAAIGDFVIAFYNPISKTRRKPFDLALSILKQYRSASTPILLARQLGRKQQSLRYYTLETLKPEDVDMFTLVIIGSSQTRLIETGFGQKFYTPRGYEKHLDEKH